MQIGAAGAAAVVHLIPTQVTVFLIGAECALRSAAVRQQCVVTVPHTVRY
jgi:hypothetical protein